LDGVYDNLDALHKCTMRWVLLEIVLAVLFIGKSAEEYMGDSALGDRRSA
jgi:hypothetical protein